MAIFPGSAIPSAGGVYTYPIDQSLRFEDGSSAYLSRTPASAGNRKTWTWSGWVKRGNLGTNSPMFTAYGGSTQTGTYIIWNPAADTPQDGLQVAMYTGSHQFLLRTSSVYRDPSAWYHVVVAMDTTQATASNRVKIFVNGSQVTDFNTATYPTQNLDTHINTTAEHDIGRFPTFGTNFDGYMAEVNFIDGQALGPEYFGETDDTWGIWKPKAYSGSYGTNGFYLDFSNGAAIGEDSSGNSNDWTASNLAATDIMLDTPTNNFCTLNPLQKNGTLSEGNLYLTTTTSGNSFTGSTFVVDSGKWYFEVMCVSLRPMAGVENFSESYSSTTVSTNGIACYAQTGGIYKDGSLISSPGTDWSNLGDVLGVAFDVDAGTIEFYVNGVSVYSGTYDWTGGAMPALGDISTSYGGNQIVNFGQDSSFAGNKTAQNNTDDNGYGDFYYAPPSGFLALCSANLDDPAVVPSENFGVLTWTGDNTSSRDITGLDFQPDFSWTKARSIGYHHRVWDSVRGTPNTSLYTSTTNIENYYSDSLYGYPVFIDGGFTAINGSDATDVLNQSSATYVAWNWKADNTSGSSNTDGSITSTVAANPDAGFSIATYTGNGTAGATVGHGLSQAPEMVICKGRSYAQGWPIYHKYVGAAVPAENVFLELNTVDYNSQDDHRFWNDTAPNATVVTLGTIPWLNNSGDTFVMYSFHSVPGYSKFGSYTGNSSTDGPFVYLGFKPAFVLIKGSNASLNWHILDNTRDPYNPSGRWLFPNTSGTEVDYTVTYPHDFLTNGFKLRAFTNALNNSAYNYIYMAFAESPFKYSTAR